MVLNLMSCSAIPHLSRGISSSISGDDGDDGDDDDGDPVSED